MQNDIKYWTLQSFLILIYVTVLVKSSENKSFHNELKDNQSRNHQKLVKKIERCPCKVNFQNAQSYILKLESKIRYQRDRDEKERLELSNEVKHLREELKSIECKIDKLINGQLLENHDKAGIEEVGISYNIQAFFNYYKYLNDKKLKMR